MFRSDKRSRGRRRNGDDPLLEKRGYQPRGRGRRSYVPPIESDSSFGQSTSQGEETETDADENWATARRDAGFNSASYTSAEGQTTEASEMEEATSIEDATPSSPHQHPPGLTRKDLNQYNSSGSFNIMSSGSFASGIFREHSVGAWAESEYLSQKQSLAFCSIFLSAAQVAVLMLQLALCGVAPFGVNIMIGPYPDQFSDWGGKNPYLMVKDLELWRLVSPAFLHVGVLHLMANAAVQLETCAYFEREWGSVRWLLIYLISELGCVMLSSIIDQDTVAVGSSGALLGLFGAKLAQVFALSAFDIDDEDDLFLNASQVLGMFCMFTLVAILSAFSYIELTGHVGGLAAGFFAGFLFLCGPIKSRCARFLLMLLGLGALVSGFASMTTYLFTEVEPDEELADPCQYFRTEFAEGYDCECLWD